MYSTYILLPHRWYSDLLVDLESTIDLRKMEKKWMDPYRDLGKQYFPRSLSTYLDPYTEGGKKLGCLNNRMTGFWNSNM